MDERVIINANGFNNGREVELANIIKEYMSDLSLTEQQESNIALLRDGAKIIGGQQAGLFGRSIATFHKIFLLLH